MALPASLRDIVGELQLLNDETCAFIDSRTGEVIMLTGAEMSMVEDGYDPDDLAPWQREIMPKVQEVLESDEWVALPSSRDLHEYRIMQDFCHAVNDDADRAELLDAIRGRGAFRYFKDTAARLGVREDWYAYRDPAYAEIAARALDAEGIPYVDDVRTGD